MQREDDLRIDSQHIVSQRKRWCDRWRGFSADVGRAPAAWRRNCASDPFFGSGLWRDHAPQRGRSVQRTERLQRASRHDRQLALFEVFSRFTGGGFFKFKDERGVATSRATACVLGSVDVGGGRGHTRRSKQRRRRKTKRNWTHQGQCEEPDSA